jgi:hypothetical protein
MCPGLQQQTVPHSSSRPTKYNDWDGLVTAVTTTGHDVCDLQMGTHSVQSNIIKQDPDEFHSTSE